MKSCTICRHARMCKYYEETRKVRKALFAHVISSTSHGLYDALIREMHKDKAGACAFFECI